MFNKIIAYFYKRTRRRLAEKYQGRAAISGESLHEIMDNAAAHMMFMRWVHGTVCLSNSTCGGTPGHCQNNEQCAQACVDIVESVRGNRSDSMPWTNEDYSQLMHATIAWAVQRHNVAV